MLTASASVISSQSKHELIDKNGTDVRRKWIRIQCLYVLHVVSTAAAISAYVYLHRAISTYKQVVYKLISAVY